MKIASSDITLQSSRVAYSRFQSSERLEMWSGERNDRGAGRAAGRDNGLGALVRDAARSNVSISKEALAAQEAETTAIEGDPLDSDARMMFLKRIIEELTGKSIRTLSPDELDRGDKTAQAQHDEGLHAQQSRPARTGFGLEYNFQASYQEYERTSFQASGTIQTADGRQIGFKLELSMERSYSESISMQMRLGDAQMKDPLVIDFAGPAAALSSMRFSFDLDANGEAENIPMLGGGRGYLAIDRNDNGRIDDGRELFGPTSGDGFAELAALDSDGNGWIDESDPGFAKLRVWNPTADGEGTLTSAAEAGIGALYLGRTATPFDLRGTTNETLGTMRTSSIYLREDGTTGTVSQIDLSV